MFRRGTLLLAATATLVVVAAQPSQARTGRAAYHLHTSAMVTAARYEPRGSVLRVKNPQNGRTVTVTVNDRGPFNGNRILDLSTGAFSQLYGGLGRGVGPVSYEVVSRGGSSLSSRSGSRLGKRKSWRTGRGSKSRRYLKRGTYRSSRR